jgi:hypothetical protein
MNPQLWQLHLLFQRAAWACAGLAALALLPVLGAARGQGQGNQQPQPDDMAPAARARFQSVPITAPQYGTNLYTGPGYSFWNNNALSGAADVINSQGQLMVSQQQAYQMKEQYRQMKIQTRRMNFDEYLYERALRPTEEDERERLRLEDLRRSRNNPPQTEIVSGIALNRLLLAIQQQQSQGVKGQDVPIEEDTLRHINFTAGQTAGSTGLLKAGARLQWPDALMSDAFTSERQSVDRLAGDALTQLQSGAVDFGTRQAMNKATDQLQTQLKNNIQEISSTDYITAKRYLNELANTIKAIGNPEVSKWTAQGRTIAALTGNMTQNGVKFAAASPGDEAAYNAMHSALVAYYIWPDQAHRWDVVAK